MERTWRWAHRSSGPPCGGYSYAVDTAIFIYFIEEHPRFPPLVESLFREVHEGRQGLVYRH
jgi:hypothetical protein